MNNVQVEAAEATTAAAAAARMKHVLGQHQHYKLSNSRGNSSRSSTRVPSVISFRCWYKHDYAVT